jgi:endo-1,4-beta-xylanase
VLPGTPHHPRRPAGRSRPASRLLLSALVGALAAVAPGPARAQSTAPLRAGFEGAGKYFGTAIQGSKLADPAYTALAAREFDMATPENELKLDATEPQQNVFTFTPGDRVVDWARQSGMRVRGGPLLWHSSPPAWMASLSSAALRAASLNHVTRVVEHYRGKVASWDVVSEAFDENGGRRPSIFQRTGNDWIEAALRAARAADPAAKLCYADYGIETWGAAKTQAVYDLVQDFKARGVPLDCVGLEGHFISGFKAPSTLRATLSAFAALGVDVALTELDVTNADPTQYAAAADACVSVPRCVGVTVWGVRDPDSWRSSESPLLFDKDGNRKPAYQAMLTVFNCCVLPYAIEVRKDGTGTGTVMSDPNGGISCGATCLRTHASGTTLTLTATADAGSRFVGWGGDCTGSGSCVVTLTADRVVTATFDLVATTTWALTVTRAGTGGGTVTSSAGGIACGAVCSAELPGGTVVTLTATPDAGSTFAGWSACQGTGPCVVTMDAARSVEAAFAVRPATPCANPITFTGSAGLTTTGAVCLRTATTVRGWGCSSFTGRTVSVNGGTATSTCGAGPFPLPRASDGYTYFALSAGAFPWASLYVWGW